MVRGLGATVSSVQQLYTELASITCRTVDHGGTGRPVVLVHGLGGNADNWNLVAPELARHGHTIALDLPGFGFSAPAPTHDLGTHVGAVAALIEGLAAGPATVVGNSMGGLIAQLLASRQPHLVHALVLLAPATPLPELTAPTDPRVTLRLALQAAPFVGPAFTRAFIERNTPDAQVAETLGIVAHRPEDLPPEVWARALEIARARRAMPWVGRAFSESARSVGRHLLARHRYETMIGSIDQPTTLIWGTRDRVVTPAALAWLARARPDWEAISLEDVGHVPMLERPGVVIEAVARSALRCQVQTAD